MPTTLEIPDQLFKRLQTLAVPFVDTPISVIEKCVADYEQRKNGRQRPVVAEEPSTAYAAKKFDPLNPPDLSHTRARGTFGSSAFSNWNDLVRIAHVAAFKKAGSFDALRNITHAQIRNGNHSANGFKFIPEIGISVQGVDAPHAWQYARRLAKFLGWALVAVIEWRHNAKAAHPGETGVLEFVPEAL